MIYADEVTLPRAQFVNAQFSTVVYSRKWNVNLTKRDARDLFHAGA